MLARPRVRVAAGEGGRGRQGEGRRASGAGPRREARGGRARRRRGRGADDDALFEELRALRREIADREGVPAYVIFHDATLREMAAVRPATAEELLDVSGVGERKLEKYGDGQPPSTSTSRGSPPRPRRCCKQLRALIMASAPERQRRSATRCPRST